MLIYLYQHPLIFLHYMKGDKMFQNIGFMFGYAGLGYSDPKCLA